MAAQTRVFWPSFPDLFRKGSVMERNRLSPPMACSTTTFLNPEITLFSAFCSGESSPWRGFYAESRRRFRFWRYFSDKPCRPKYPDLLGNLFHQTAFAQLPGLMDSIVFAGRQKQYSPVFIANYSVFAGMPFFFPEYFFLIAFDFLGL
jgi:hypothetical protein